MNHYLVNLMIRDSLLLTIFSFPNCKNFILAETFLIEIIFLYFLILKIMRINLLSIIIFFEMVRTRLNLILLQNLNLNIYFMVKKIAIIRLTY